MSSRVRNVRKGGKRRVRTTRKTPALSGSDMQAQTSVNARTHSVMFRKRVCDGALYRPLNPFPDSLRVTLTTNLTGVIATGATATQGYDVYMNSPFLPWNNGGNSWPAPLTAVGSVIPAGYTSLCAAAGPYVNYRVYGSSIRVEMSINDNDDQGLITIAPVVGTSTYTANRFAQSRFSVSGLCDATQKNTYSNSTSTVEVSGDAPAMINTSGFSGAYNGYPTFAAIWHTQFSTADATVTDAPIEYRVTVSYDCVFENPQYDQALETIDIPDEQVSAFNKRRATLRRERDLAAERELTAATLKSLSSDSDCKASSASPSWVTVKEPATADTDTPALSSSSSSSAATPKKVAAKAVRK